MTGAVHNKILAVGFAAFATIIFFTFLLLALVSIGVFVALGITFASESGDPNPAGVGILGAIFTVVFYGGLGLICVLPPAIASWKMISEGREPECGESLRQSLCCQSLRWEPRWVLTVCGSSSARKAAITEAMLSQ